MLLNFENENVFGIESCHILERREKMQKRKSRYHNLNREI